MIYFPYKRAFNALVDVTEWVIVVGVLNKLPYRTKLWRGENFGEFGESPQFAKFFSPKFPMKHENAGKPWIRQSFFRQYFKIIISPNFFTAKVLFYTVIVRYSI